MADNYSWASSITGGAWNSAGNWEDTTTNATATTPPAAANATTVTGGAGTNFQIVTGPGAAAGLDLLGNTAFEGAFSAAGVTAGTTSALGLVGATDIEHAATLADSGTLSTVGELQIDGTGALVQAASLILAQTGYLYDLDGAALLAAGATIAGQFYVDPLGRAEIGSAGGVGAGSLAVDAGAGLTLLFGAELTAEVALAGALTVNGVASIFGDVTGGGALSVAGTADLQIFGTLAGLATVLDNGVTMSANGVDNVGLLTLGTLANATFDELTGVGTLTTGARSNVTVSGDVTGGGAILIGSTAALTIGGTAAGGGGISVGAGGTLAFAVPADELLDPGTPIPGAPVISATLLPQDLDVPIALGAGAVLAIAAGTTIGGAVSGLVAGDLITVTANNPHPAAIITGATYVAASGTLLLTDDGTIVSAVSLAGAPTGGAQFLTDIVGLPDGFPIPADSLQAATTDVALSAGTLAGLGGTGSVTVTGATGPSFVILAGNSQATAIDFIDSTALVGSIAATSVTIDSTGAGLNALDLQAGATLTAAAKVLVTGNAEVDGPGARIATPGTLSVNGGAVAAVNGGTVQAGALGLLGTLDTSLLFVDPAGAIEIGTLADAQAGALLIDTGATLSSAGENTIIGAVIDNGAIVLASSGGESPLTIDGTLAGSGIVTVGTGALLSVSGDLDGLTAITVGPTGAFDVAGNLASPVLLTIGTFGDVDVGGNVSGLAGLSLGSGGDVLVDGSVTGSGPITIGATADFDVTGAVAGTGSFAIGANADVALGGVSGFSQITMASLATLGVLGGASVPIAMGGTAETLEIGASVDLTGIVTGFAIGDLIDVAETAFGSALDPVTAATFGGGFLTLSNDGTLSSTIAMATPAPGAQFLTNAVELPDAFIATDIVLATAGPGAIGTGGTVTGAAGAQFDLLTGSGSTTALILLGNLALEGSYAGTASVTVGSTLLPTSAVDIESSATLAAGAASVAGGVEVDGAAARFLTAGTLAIGGGSAPTAEVLAVNGGQVQAGSVLLAASPSFTGAELAVDPAGLVEVGAAGGAAVGALTVDAGSTLTAAATDSTLQAAAVIDNGLIRTGPSAATVLTVDGTLSGTGTLALTADTSATVTALGNFGSITAGTLSSLEVLGDIAGIGSITTATSASVTVTGSVSNAGSITLGGTSHLDVFGDLTGNGGVLSIGAGAVADVIGTLSGFASIVIGAGGTLEIERAEIATPIVMDAGSTLVIDPSSTLTGTIEGFATGDVIAVTEAPDIIATEADLAGGTLLISDDGTIGLSLSLAGNFGDQQFLTNVAPASALGAVTDITLATPCFAAGTGIATLRGRVPVEALQPGDTVPTLQGGTRPVVWVGHRRVDCRAHPHPERVWPVEIAADAFGPGQPARPLRLSPDHAVHADGVLIPIKHLINDRSIRQLPVASVTYYHVELSRHDVLWADGLAAESYLDTGNRAAFANGRAHVQLHPDFFPLSWDQACAPLVEAGARLVAEKARLFDRAGAAAPPARGLDVRAGRRVLPAVEVQPGAWRYTVPPQTRRLTLSSPAWMPAAVQPTSLDRRRLGVRLFAVQFDATPIALADAAFAAGFHPIETTLEGPCRWTDGHADLRLPPRTGTVTLTVADAA